MSTLIRDIFNIPETAGAEDFVLRLSENVGDEADRALDTYVITEDIAEAFDLAMSVVVDAIKTGNSRAAFLSGSFGSGKSHFMAVLHAILTGHPAPRRRQELHGAFAKYGDALQGKRILPVPIHMLAEDTTENGLYEAYLKEVVHRHGGGSLPELFASDDLLARAEELRAQLGDEKFFSIFIGGDEDADSGWGDFASENSWTRQRFDAARSALPGDPERQALIDALPASLGGRTVKDRPMPLEDGLAAMAKHAQTLGYDAVVLFIDELILWLMLMVINDRPKFTREVQKLTKLVETGTGRRDIPLVSFVARQVDLKAYFSDSGSTGEEQRALETAFDHQSGRFSNVLLGDTNIAHVANKRLLEPHDDQARAELEAAFARVSRTREVWQVLLDAVGADDQQGKDENFFKLTYPFSPALVSTLRDLAGVMQRDRTALKVMQRMLVDRRDTFTINELIPVGDAFDYIVQGDQHSMNPATAAKFRAAEKLYTESFKPVVLSTLGLEPGHEHEPAAQKDLRLAKTLVLSAIAPQTPALRGLTAKRIAALNHGSVSAPIPGTEGPAVLSKIRKWAPQIPEIAISDDPDPVVTVQLTEIDYERIVREAADADSSGSRRVTITRLIAESMGIHDLDRVPASRDITWRGTRRNVLVRFGNVRDRTDIEDAAFEGTPGSWTVVVDYPFDEQGHDNSDDRRRMERLEARDDWHTLVWLPLFFSGARQRDVGRLAILNKLLDSGEQEWQRATGHLSAQDAAGAHTVLSQNRKSLRETLMRAVLQCYGVENPAPENISSASHEDEYVYSMTKIVNPARPVGSDLGQALERIVGQALSAQYPEHPDFVPGEKALRPTDVRRAATLLEDAAAKGGRADVTGDAQHMRRIINSLGLGHVGEAHCAVSLESLDPWAAHFERKVGAHGDAPVTVADARGWVRSHPRGAGLTSELVDLVVIAWVATTRRAWIAGGAAVPAELITPGKLMATWALVAQDLPGKEDWDAARELLQLVAGNREMSAAPIHARMVNAQKKAKGWAEEHRGGVEHLVTQLRRVGELLNLRQDAPRLEDAMRAARLLEVLASADPAAQWVRALAAFDMQDRGDALSKTVSSATAVAGELARLTDDLLRKAAVSADSGVQAVLDRLRDTVAHDVFAADAVGKLPALGDELTRALLDLTPQPQVTPPEPPRPDDVTLDDSRAPSAGGRERQTRVQRPELSRPAPREDRVLITDQSALKDVYRDIARAQAEYAGKRIQVEWRVID